MVILSVLALYLAVQSISGRFVEETTGPEPPLAVSQVVLIFNINRESSIPTWYATMLLIAASLLLGLIARVKRRDGERYAGHWTGLALIFLYLSIDEAAAIHEKFTIPLQETFNTAGPLYFAWILVGIPFAGIVGLLYLRFLIHLPSKTRNLFLLAALFYIGAALGIEAIGADRWFQDDGTSLIYSAIGTVEEFFEMVGVIVFLYALLTYITPGTERIQFAISLQPPVELSGGESMPADE